MLLKLIRKHLQISIVIDGIICMRVRGSNPSTFSIYFLLYLNNSKTSAKFASAQS